MMGITFGDHLIDSGYYDITPEKERELDQPFPPSCCNAWEDCNHDGVCHDPQTCGGFGPNSRNEREIRAREECERRGIDPDEICADGGVTAWMVVDQERLSKAGSLIDAQDR